MDIAWLAETFRKQRVLVVGDLMLDEHVWGVARRISPEAPVPVVEVRRRTYVPGGAANVAANVVALSGEAIVCGVIGNDPAGMTLRAAMQSLGIDCRLVVEDAARPTTTKTRIIAHNQHVVRVDVEDRAPVPPPIEKRIVDGIERAVAEASVVVLSDYGKGVVSQGVAQAAISGAKKHGKTTIVDPKGRSYQKYLGASVITPNVSEARQALGIDPDEEVSPDRLGEGLRRLLPGTVVLLTRGELGMMLFEDGRPAITIRAESRAVYDVTGAGDTVVATLALGIGAGLDLLTAACLANTAAGIVVGKVGTAVVTLEELATASRAKG